MTLTLGLAQCYPQLSNVAENVARHCEWLQRAAAKSIDALLFPELSLCGYQLQDLVPEVAMAAAESDERYRPILAATRATGVDALVGFVQSDSRHQLLSYRCLLQRRPMPARSPQTLPGYLFNV